VRNYLVSRGADAARIRTEGRGETQPIADNTTEEGRARNRRVEVQITERGANKR
jgi:outer membrane protein OmpA-like peptidoglycan-associated protein